ncbi:hypothetical protein BIY37_08775 [Candidatus Brocadia sapporoensis]|uniref:Aminotransferase class III n=1 Tax=Candidatus Brocadia sapporoensis TaxID=392547 RepID=A0A1V6LYZ2_9BACT|nr:aminotransferase class III-fold pyridoxal phosphate-dependent enzyme [Candidatus Brocadia sapporoensis]MDG6005222.1 aminotransferase class III-fold pyridoxal phosphate-dependent enzyme [Candidatus Brocadia sp.]OQD45350.1 hypothetical protein BIY37_08775 [Candidatus Brocadia sapporoensis]GJQ24179.1 MAG: hypothetical protein HBSAPP01_19690 [Candidatus Brocadia sapporoensis]
MDIADVDNNAFLGFTASVAVYNTGHSHNQIVSAINSQAETLVYMSGTIFIIPSISSWQKIFLQFVPDLTQKSLLRKPGVESVEAAFKLARYYIRRYIN